MQTTYIEVSAQVRYWEDATINGTTDTDGTLAPMRKDDCWAPVIRLADGMVMDWPQGTTADVHFKVCDAGEYWLLDDEHVLAPRGYPPAGGQGLGKKEQVLLDVAVFPRRIVALGDGLIGVDIADGADTILIGVDAAGDQRED